MNALASIADYEELFGDLTSSQQTAVAAALDAASAQIRSYTRQRLDYVENDTVVLSGSGADRLLLPELPVIAVASVTFDQGGACEAAISDFFLDSNGVLCRCGGWRWGYGNFTVVYTHGYQTIPADVVTVAAHLARDLTTVSPGLRSETIAGYSYTRDGSAATISPYGAILDGYRPGRR